MIKTTDGRNASITIGTAQHVEHVRVPKQSPNFPYEYGALTSTPSMILGLTSPAGVTRGLANLVPDTIT